MRDSVAPPPQTRKPKPSFKHRLQLFWERLEDPSRQIRYSFYFTITIHVVLILVLVGQVHWQINLVESEPIGIRYAEPEAAATPTLIAKPIEAPTPIIPPPIETPPPPPPPVVETPTPPTETTLALPSIVQKKVEEKPKPIPKPEVKPAPKPTPKVEPKPAPKAESKPKVEPKKEPEKKMAPDSKTPAKETVKAKPVDKPKEESSDELLNSLINRVTQVDKTSSQTPTPAKVPINKLGSATGVGGGDVGQGLGAQDGLRNAASEEYKNQIQRAILRNINYPEGINNNPQVTLLIEQNEQGEVQSVKIEKTSGINAFDEAVVRAVYAASPLPLPKQANMWNQSFKLVWRRFGN